jgi:hypothetical protein
VESHALRDSNYDSDPNVFSGVYRISIHQLKAGRIRHINHASFYDIAITKQTRCSFVNGCGFFNFRRVKCSRVVNLYAVK